MGEVARSRQARLGALSLVLALAILHNLPAGKAKRCPKRESPAQRRALAQKWVLDRGVFLLPDTIVQSGGPKRLAGPIPGRTDASTHFIVKWLLKFT